MKQRLIVAICLAMAGWSEMGLATHPTLAASLCVGGPGCYPTIQAALSAAQDGDVLHIGPGTYSGTTPSPIIITKSVQLMGAGAGKTIIQGGGPVVTIGDPTASVEPTVSISALTITGGLNTSTPVPFFAVGGGLTVVSPAAGGPGAIVTITDSRIAGNRAAPAGNLDCGSGCTFAGVLAGGIVNEGTLTLRTSSVSDNSAGVTTDATCVFGSGGGIYSDGPVTMDGSTISGNSVTVSSTSTSPICDFHGVGGGMRLTQSASAIVRGSLITGNSVTTMGTSGVANSEAGGIDEDGSILLQDSTVSDNRITSIVTSTLPSALAGSDGGAMEIDGAATIKNTKIIGNSASASSPAGILTEFWIGSPTSDGGGLVVTTGYPVTITDSVISGNSVSATTTSGVAKVVGGGIFNCSATLTLKDTTVSNNSGSAQGPPTPGSAAQGAGIWNSDCGGGPPAMTLIDSAVTHNSLTASSGIPVQGGGVFNTGTLRLINSVIAQNSPDQCFGC